MKTTQFDQYELMLLEASLSPSEVSSDPSAMFIPPYLPTKELCLKVGCALIQAMEKGREEILSLTPWEAWVLRERISLFAGVGQRPDAGLVIKTKLYRMLLDYDTEDKLGMEISVAAHEERSAREVKSELASRQLFQPTD